MKQELKYTLEIEKDEKIFTLTMPANVPLGMAYDCCYEFLAVLKKNIDEQNKKLAELKEKEEIKEESI